MRRLLALAFALLLGSHVAHAQQTKAQLTTEINANYPDNTSGLITPSILRTTTIDQVNSFQQAPRVNAQTGTSYTFVVGDYGLLVTFSNASPVGVSLPQATGSFVVWNATACNNGAGAVTITPTVSTIGGASTLVLQQGQCRKIISDGTNYQLTGNSIQPVTCTSSQWINAITSGGIPQCSQPAFTDISGTLQPNKGGTGTTTVPTTTQIPIGTAGSVYAPQTITGDASVTAGGVWTNAKVNGVAYSTSPATNTVPVVTSANTVTYETVPNNALANSSITINAGTSTGLTAPGTLALGATGTIGAITDVPRFAGINVPVVKPNSDTTTALKLTKADGTTGVVVVDTLNNRVGINKTPGAFDLDTSGALNVGSTLTFTTLDATSLGNSTTTITGLTINNTPSSSNDYIPYFSASAGKIVRCTVGSCAAAATAGVSSLNGLTGGLSIVAGGGTSVSAAGTSITLGSTRSIVKQTFCPSGCTTTVSGGGTGTYTPTSGMTFAILECVGGGGGAGGVTGQATSFFVGGGGGAGSYARKYVTATDIGASKTVAIGSAGNGGAAGNNNGAAGGDSCFTSSTCTSGQLVAGKGGAGGLFASGAQVGNGGAGGVAGTGDIAGGGPPGLGGINGVATTAVLMGSGNGGSSVFGGGAAPSALVGATATAGVNAAVYGSGGSGANAHNTTNTAAGGNGSAGFCIATEFVNL